jgi:hypothetical protein
MTSDSILDTMVSALHATRIWDTLDIEVASIPVVDGTASGLSAAKPGPGRGKKTGSVATRFSQRGRDYSTSKSIGRPARFKRRLPGCPSPGARSIASSRPRGPRWSLSRCQTARGPLSEW